MYKFSKFTREYVMEDIHVFYNMVTDSIVTVTPDAFDIIANNYNNIDNIRDIHPDLFDIMLTSNCLVKESVKTEANEIVKCWEHEDSVPEHIKITIIPTIQCNLRCWYCYENHDTTEVISSSRIASIMKYIERTAQLNSVKKIIIDFFGGEPLLCFDNCIKPIVLYAEKVCQKYSKGLGIAFTTNGVLLTEDKCDFLSGINALTSFQITFDGDESSHNAVRFLKGGIGTYRTIIHNVLYGISKKLHFTIRFNYTHKNHSSYQSTIDELLNNISNTDKQLIDFSFHKVWQEQETSEIESSMSTHRQTVGKKGYNYNIPVNWGSVTRCYADNPNDIVINHNGNIYKCTARDFTPERAEGVLKSDGTILWNKNSILRRQLMYGSEYCKNCKIFPICHGGCSQNKLERLPETNSCIFNYTENQKELLVKNRVIELLQQYLINNK